MKKLMAILAALMLTLSSCSLKSPIEDGAEVQTLDPDGTVTTMSARSYAIKLQTEVIGDCRNLQREEMNKSWEQIASMEGSDKLTALVSNQWKEAMIAINGKDYCKPGTNEYDAYIAYAEAQGKIYTVAISELGKTLRFSAGAFAAYKTVDVLAGAIGDRVAGDKMVAGNNASKTTDNASNSITSSETNTETHATTSSSQIATSESEISNPASTNEFPEVEVPEGEI